VKHLLTLILLINVAFAQTYISQPYIFQKWIKVTDSARANQVYANYVMQIPSDTVNNKKGIAQIGKVIYVGNGVNWFASNAFPSLTLQQVTDAGYYTTNPIQSSNYIFSASGFQSGYTSSQNSNLFPNYLNFFTTSAVGGYTGGPIIRPANSFYNDTNRYTLYIPKKNDTLACLSDINLSAYKLNSDSSNRVSGYTTLNKHITDSSTLRGLINNKINISDTNNYFFKPIPATSSVIGGVKVGSNITLSGNTISLNNSNIIAALGYMPIQLSSLSGTTSANTQIFKYNNLTGNFNFDSTRVIKPADTTGIRAQLVGSGNVSISGTYPNLTINGSGTTYTANQPIKVTGSVISADTITRYTGLATLGKTYNDSLALKIDSINLITPTALFTSPINFSKTISSWNGTQSLANQTAGKVFSRLGSTGTPSFQFLDTTVFNNLFAYYVRAAQSGGGSPGGSSTQVQFNQSGSFTGNSSFTYDSTNHSLSILQPNSNNTNNLLINCSGVGGNGANQSVFRVLSSGSRNSASFNDNILMTSAGNITMSASNAAITGLTSLSMSNTNNMLSLSYSGASNYAALKISQTNSGGIGGYAYSLIQQDNRGANDHAYFHNNGSNPIILKNDGTLLVDTSTSNGTDKLQVNGSLYSLAIKTAAKQTTFNDSTGTAIFSQPEQGTSYKKVLIFCNGIKGATTYTYTFPTAFTANSSSTPPVVIFNNTTITPTISNTQVAITPPLNSGSATTGYIIIEGF
jgi:hypothetical protein